MNPQILDRDAHTIHELVFGKADEPLSDLEEDDHGPRSGGSSCRRKRSQSVSEKKILSGFYRQDRKSISAAKENTTTFATFGLRWFVESAYNNTTSPSSRAPESITSWLDGFPRMAVDAEGIPIVLHIPRWQRGKALDIFNEICHQLAEVMPPTIGDGADRNGRNLDSSYRWEKGELCGQIKIVTSWHAIGHPKFAASMKALSEFRILTKRLNGVLDLLDEGAADQYRNLRTVSMGEMQYLRGINTLDPSYWQAEWTPLHAAGGFTEGGSLFIHELNLRLRYLPGDLIFLRGSLLSHSVEPWSGGQ